MRGEDGRFPRAAQPLAMTATHGTASLAFSGWRVRSRGVIQNARTVSRLGYPVWVRDYEVDLIVGNVDIVRGDVEFHSVRSTRFVLVTAPDHTLAGRASVPIEEAARCPFIGHSTSRYFGQLAGIMFRLHGVAPETVVEVDGWGVMPSDVAAGVGIALVPDVCLPSLKSVTWRVEHHSAARGPPHPTNGERARGPAHMRSSSRSPYAVRTSPEYRVAIHTTERLVPSLRPPARLDEVIVSRIGDHVAPRRLHGRRVQFVCGSGRLRGWRCADSARICVMPQTPRESTGRKMSLTG